MDLSVIGDENLTDARDVQVDTEVERSQRSHDDGSKGDEGLVTSDLNNEVGVLSSSVDVSASVCSDEYAKCSRNQIGVGGHSQLEDSDISKFPKESDLSASKSPHLKVSRSQRRRLTRYKDATGLVAQRPGDEVENATESTETFETLRNHENSDEEYIPGKDADPDLSFSDSSDSEYIPVSVKDADPDLSFSDSSDSEYIPVSVKDADPDLSFCDSSDAEYIHGKDVALESIDAASQAIHFSKDGYVSNSTCSDSDESFIIPLPTMKTISVQQTDTKQGKQKWDKKHACKFCGKMYSKLARHLEAIHEGESEVAKALSFPKNSTERKEIWKTIRNEGDWEHNFNVLKNKSGTLIPKYREGKARSHEEFVPCSVCKGLYCKTSLSEHFKVCAGKQTEKKKNQGVKEGRLLLPISDQVHHSFYKDVLLTMNQDEIFSHISRDPLILKFGQRLYENKDIQEHTSNHISCRMRELGRLIVEAKRRPELCINKVEDCFAPEQFNNVVSCVKSLAGFSEETHLYRTPSLALKIGYSLQRCARIHRSDGIIESDKGKQDSGSAFIQLYESDWNDLISSRARQTLTENRYNSPKMLPLSEDVYKLNSYLKEKVRDLLPKLATDVHYYWELAKVTLCHITLFNRKRGGDVQRITLNNFKQAIEAQNNIPNDAEIVSSLSDFELQLCRSMTRIELKGKQERKVAILLTKDMIKSINLLIEKRSDANVSGKYLFARQAPSLRTMRARDVLSEISGKIGLTYGNLMTYTNLRKHIATMAQIHELSENGQDQLATFLGHDIRVHREVYRKPLDIIQKTKISKMLMLINEGTDVADMTFENEEELNEVVENDESEDEQTNDQNKEERKKNHGKRKSSSSAACRSSVPESTCAKRQKIVKNPWTTSEMQAVKKHFGHFISMMKVPGKNDIDGILKKDKSLSNRNWRNVKDQVYNLIKKQRKC